MRKRGAEASWLRGRSRYMRGTTTTAADRFVSTPQAGIFMCDYLLMGMPNRLARKAEEFVTLELVS